MITTQRLLLIPLDYTQELNYLSDNGELESKLGLVFIPGKLPLELKKVIKAYILPLFIQEPANYLFFTNWIVIQKSSQFIVADLAFKGKPDCRGVSEIGYGTYEHYRNMGFMTEAIQGLINWAFAQGKLKVVTAETDKNNLASRRVLEKNGFEITERVDDQIYWEKIERL